MTYEDLIVPPTPVELAELTRAVAPSPEMANILRRLIFQRDALGLNTTELTP